MMKIMHQNTTENNTATPGLCNEIRLNNDGVLAKLYRDNYNQTERYVINNHGSVEEAKDIFQEAFIAVWRNIQAQKFSPDNETTFAAYLYQVAKFKWLDILRAQKRQLVIPALDITGHEEFHSARNEPSDLYTSLVRKHFLKLGQTCRQVLTQFYFQGQSLQHIAAGRKWTEATAKNNKYRCIQQLRSLVKKEKY